MNNIVCYYIAILLNHYLGDYKLFYARLVYYTVENDERLC